jgi:hypothetical protein
MNKKIVIFESSIIGLFVGVIVASYLSFLSATDGYVGMLLHWISLHNFISYIPAIDSSSLVVTFVYTVLVFTVYGACIGLCIAIGTKPGPIVAVGVLALSLVGADQVLHMSKPALPIIEPTTFVASAIKSVSREPKQYFGMEARGDINRDGKDDVAFIIHRDDTDRGTLYYVSSSLNTEKGMSGTNLLFLGDKVIPDTIIIADNKITIAAHNKATTTLTAFVNEQNTLVFETSTSTTR